MLIKNLNSFVQRNTMHKRRLCCRRVSSCPSGTLVHSIHTVEDIVKVLSWTGSLIILVFDPSTVTQFQREPFQRRRSIEGIFFCNFRLKSPSISETVRDTIERYWEVICVLSNGDIFNDLHGP